MLIHRVATSDLYRASPAEIRREWSFRELHVAHLTLDFARDKAEEERRKAEDEEDENARRR